MISVMIIEYDLFWNFLRKLKVGQAQAIEWLESPLCIHSTLDTRMTKLSQSPTLTQPYRVPIFISYFITSDK